RDVAEQDGGGGVRLERARHVAYPVKRHRAVVVGANDDGPERGADALVQRDAFARARGTNVTKARLRLETLYGVLGLRPRALIDHDELDGIVPCEERAHRFDDGHRAILRTDDGRGDGHAKSLPRRRSGAKDTARSSARRSVTTVFDA